MLIGIPSYLGRRQKKGMNHFRVRSQLLQHLPEKTANK